MELLLKVDVLKANVGELASAQRDACMQLETSAALRPLTAAAATLHKNLDALRKAVSHASMDSRIVEKHEDAVQLQLMMGDTMLVSRSRLPVRMQRDSRGPQWIGSDTRALAPEPLLTQSLLADTCAAAAAAAAAVLAWPSVWQLTAVSSVARWLDPCRLGSQMRRPEQHSDAHQGQSRLEALSMQQAAE